MKQTLTVDVQVRPFFNGEELTADRLNSLVEKINAVNSGQFIEGQLLESHERSSLPALALGVAGAAIQSRRKLSRRSLLGLR